MNKHASAAIDESNLSPKLVWEKYSNDVYELKKRKFVFLKDAQWAYYYACYFLGRKWEEAEPIIMKNAECAFLYTLHILNKKRWKKAEPFIMQDAKYAYHYAYIILNKKRWKEAEPFIMQNARYAYLYAYHILNGRWEEAERYIKQDDFLWNKYQKYI